MAFNTASLTIGFAGGSSDFFPAAAAVCDLVFIGCLDSSGFRPSTIF
jgi:hypothetical protein